MKIQRIVVCIFGIGRLVFAHVGTSADSPKMNSTPNATFHQVDTTPPVVNVPFPPPDTSVNERTAIRAQFSDVGSGIDISSARLLLDGEDVTKQATVTAQGITFQTSKPRDYGIHQVEITVADKAGNQSNYMSWRFGVDAPAPAEAKCNNEIFLLNGKPFFPIGIYNCTCNPRNPRFKEAVLEQAAAAGFNFHLGPAGAKEHLDMLLKHGMKAMIHVRQDDLKQCVDPEQAKELLVTKGEGQWKNHPALVAYWSDSVDSVFSQAEIPKEEAVRRLALGYQTLKEHDPKHLVFWGLSHRDTFMDYAGVCGDVLFTFFYPVLQADYPASSISEIMIQPAKEAVARKKPVWFASQAVDLRINRGKALNSANDFRPTPAEMRVMNYLALVDGVKGLIVYASGGSPEPEVYNDLVEYPAQWQEALKIAGEIRYLLPILAAGKPAQTASLKSKDPKIRYLELKYEGTHTLIAVNVADAPVSVVWQFSNPVQPAVLFEDRTASKPAATIDDAFKPYEVHIYRWQERSRQ